MKTRLVVASLMIMHWVRVFGQNDNTSKELIERARMKYHLSVGASVSKMQSNLKDFEEVLERRGGYVIQVGISQYLNPRFDLALFFGFSNKGNIHRAKIVDTSTNPPMTVESIDYETLNYMVLSLMPTYYIDKRCRLGISLGPYLGWQISDKLYWEQYIDGVLSSKHADYNILGYKRFDVGVSSELSYRFSPLKSVDALLKLRWDRGFFNVSPGGAAMYNQIFAFQVGVIL